MKRFAIRFFGALLLTACNTTAQGAAKHLAQLETRLNALRGNWALAAYELDELKEGLDTAVTLYPHFKEVKVPLNQAVKLIESAV